MITYYNEIMKQEMVKPANITVYVRFMTFQELRLFYGIGYRAMRNQIDSIKDEVGIRIGHYYTPRQVATILGTFGVPRKYVMEVDAA